MTGSSKGSSSVPSIVWLRDDLRLDDNPALSAAVDHGGAACIVYILDEASPGIRSLGAAAKWWLHHSLESLSAAIERLGGRLILRRGPAAAVIAELVEETGADAVFWNRRYGHAERDVDAGIKAWAEECGVSASSFAANLLFEPWQITTGSGSPYKVFTPFWRACLDAPDPRQPLEAPRSLRSPAASSDKLADWELPPQHPDWSGGLAGTWHPGEAGAVERVTAFLEEGLEGYARRREEPGVEGSSRLSPHLRFGEISPYRLWHELRRAPQGDDLRTFKSELGWREFCWQLLYFNPKLASVNYRPEFDAFPWAGTEHLRDWQKGRTGYPLVDAGMRQLRETGWMHNRVRMAAASFLIKNLLIDWRVGEKWFWDTLVDADAANNPANWQWVAGSGADASPYFRIFNPVTQSKKFDPAGNYLRRYLPELAGLDDRTIHEPWKADGTASDYPAPVVELGASRSRALDAYDQVKGR